MFPEAGNNDDVMEEDGNTPEGPSHDDIGHHSSRQKVGRVHQSLNDR
jgi:hypothetical protein